MTIIGKWRSSGSSLLAALGSMHSGACPPHLCSATPPINWYMVWYHATIPYAFCGRCVGYDICGIVIFGYGMCSEVIVVVLVETSSAVMVYVMVMVLELVGLWWQSRFI